MIRKDTVMVPAGGYVVIDFIADNPGHWFLHCHIESHQREGMGMVINEVQLKQNPPPDDFQTCGNFNWTEEEFNEKLEFSGGAMGLDVGWKMFMVVALIGIATYCMSLL